MWLNLVWCEHWEKQQLRARSLCAHFDIVAEADSLLSDWADLARVGQVAWKELWLHLRKLAYSFFFHYHLSSRDVSFVHWSLLVTASRLWWSVFREEQVSPWCSPLLCQHIWKICIRTKGIHQGMLKICRFALMVRGNSSTQCAPSIPLMAQALFLLPSISPCLSGQWFTNITGWNVCFGKQARGILAGKRRGTYSTSTSHGHMDVGMEHYLEGLCTGNRGMRCGLWQGALMGTTSLPQVKRCFTQTSCKGLVSS